MILPSLVRYDVDLKGSEDAVILNVEVQERATGVWGPIDLERVYTVATNSFTALGRGIGSRPILPWRVRRAWAVGGRASRRERVAREPLDLQVQGSSGRREAVERRP